MSHKSKVIADARKRFFQGIGVPEQGTFVVDEFQKEAIQNITDGHDTLVVAPTGAGKTYIAMEAIRATLEHGKRAVYTTPLKALSNTKFTELKKRFEPQYQVGLLTGDRKIEGNADVVVATTEIYRNELYRSAERHSLVILDEVHFLADAQRGPVWEESIILTPTATTLLMLSASISNSKEISEWIHDVRGKECRVVIRKDRPVELRFGFLHPELGVLPLCDERGEILQEVRRFYGAVGLDASGMRLKGGKFDRPRRGRSRFRRGRR